MTEAATFRVTVLPGDIEIEARQGESLMEAANRQGWYWPTVCGGSATCTRCYMVVPEESQDAFTPMSSAEETALRTVRWLVRERPGERLACEARVLADAAVRKRFVRPMQEADRRRDAGRGIWGTPTTP